jgi:NitT/TauT family transport system substrate-binding protein
MQRRSLMLSLAAGAAVLGGPPARAEADAVRLSHGLGVLYLPLIVMREGLLLERHLDAAGINAAVSWLTLDGGGQINDAMLAGALDIAGTSIPGFLMLWSKGRGTRSEVVGVAGLSSTAMMLNTNRPDIKTLADFKSGDKIAVPSVKVSLQAVVLQMAVAQAFGEAE